MPKIAIDTRSDDTARERIFKAAMLRFSTHSYEETGLGDLAADVGGDPAYVHRRFGSKEKLLYQAPQGDFPARTRLRRRGGRSSFHSGEGKRYGHQKRR